MNPFLSGSLYIFVSAFGFGLLPIFAMRAYEEGTNVSTVLFFRFVIAAALFFAFLLATKQKIRLSLKQAVILFCLGGVLYTLQSFSYLTAVKYIPASLASLLLYTFPVYVALLSVWLDKEKLSLRTILSIALSMVGLVLVLGTSFGGMDWFGTGCALAAAIFYSCYIILGNRMVKGVPPVMTSAFVSLFAALSLLVVGNAGEGIDFFLSGKEWLGILGVALFATVLAIVCFFRGLQLIGSTKASVLSMFEPVVTVAFSAWLFAERLSAWQMLGGCVVLVGAFLIVTAQQQQQTRPLPRERTLE